VIVRKEIVMSIIIYNRTPLGVDGTAVGVATIEGVVRAGRAVRAVTFGYLEVRSRRTRRVAVLAPEPSRIDFFLEIPPALEFTPGPPTFYQQLQFPPRTTRSERRSDTLRIAELP
jgi:hypothetical protein